MFRKGSSNASGGHVPSSASQCAFLQHEGMELESLFECPVCSDSVLPPIIQCARGHLVCSECLRMVDGKCPTCREPVGHIRNLAMENLAKQIVFSCKFKPAGCPCMLPAEDKKIHQQSCVFRPIHCPYRNMPCRWEGSVDEVTAHLLGSHDHVTALEGNEVILRAKCDYGAATAQWKWIQLCFRHTFMITLRKTLIAQGLHYFCGVVQSVDVKGTANQFAYHLDYRGPGGVSCYEGMPLGMHDSPEVAMENGDCLEFEVTTGQLQRQGGLMFIKSIVTHLV